VLLLLHGDIARESGEHLLELAYAAQDADQLQKVFSGLPRDVTVSKQKHEITSTFAVIGALLALAAVAASIRWSPYP